MSNTEHTDSSATEPVSEQGEIERVAKLDADRNERDRRAARGYDCERKARDSSTTRDAEIDRLETLDTEGDDYRRAVDIAQQCERSRDDLEQHLIENAPELLEPEVLIQVCEAFGVGLIFENGGLAVHSDGRAWRGLIDALAIHESVITELLKKGK
jgi:hypothetical protein